MSKREHGPLANAASLLVCGLLAGLVVAAALFPALAIPGLAAKAGADAFSELPAELESIPAPQISHIYASDGKTLIAMVFDEYRRDVELTDIAPVMAQAIVAAEDQRFYKHKGVDMKGVARAFVANQQSDGLSQGASTLTQQLVRQQLAYTAKTPTEVIKATEKSPARKITEMKRALELEKRLSKDEILKRYLNIASFGHTAYGIYAASQVYFGKVPKDLTLPEAALLAGLVKAPSSYDPADPEKKPAALDRRVYVLDSMVEMGYITQAQADEAKQHDTQIVGKRESQGCASVQRPELGAGFFCDYLYRWWQTQEAFGVDRYERENKLRSGGYTVVSSLDVGIQAAARKRVEDQVKTGSSDALMVALVEVGTGRVLSLATNRHYSNDQSKNGPNTEDSKRKAGIKGNYPATTLALITGGGGVHGYQAGSTFKAFTTVAALEDGLPLDYTIRAVSPYPSKLYYASGASACKSGPMAGHWCPKNANPGWMNGLRNLWTCFGRSVNTCYVPLEERVGADKVVDAARRLGIEFREPGDNERASKPEKARDWGAFTLGVSLTTPLDLANAYATLANDGKYCEPIPVKEIVDFDGNKLDTADPRCKQAIKEDVARATVDTARCPIGDQSAFGKCDGGTASEVRGIVGYPVMGKTGTTDGDRTATLAVSTRQIAAAGIMADPDDPQTNRSMSSGRVNAAVSYALRDAMKGLPRQNFVAPSRSIAFGERARIPDVRCQSVDSAKRTLERAGFTVYVDETGVASQCPKGTAAGTDPSGETVKNGAVTILVSKGEEKPDASPGPPGGGGGGGGPTDPRCRRNPGLCPPRN